MRVKFLNSDNIQIHAEVTDKAEALKCAPQDLWYLHRYPLAVADLRNTSKDSSGLITGDYTPPPGMVVLQVVTKHVPHDVPNRQIWIVTT